MPQRSLKSICIEIASLLTLFALLGTMTSNFWERYLIQSELSNIKSSLYILKETVYSIGAAYDNLQRGLLSLNKEKSPKTALRKESSLSQLKDSRDLNSFSDMVSQKIIKLKESVGDTAFKVSNNNYLSQKTITSGSKNASVATNESAKATDNDKYNNLETSYKVKKRCKFDDYCEYQYNCYRNF